MADDMLEKSKELSNVPLGYSLHENYLTAVMGEVDKGYNFINNIILQLMTFYCYDELKFIDFFIEINKDKIKDLKDIDYYFDLVKLNKEDQNLLLKDLFSLTLEEKDELIVAYEPIWSIGTGIIPRNKEIYELGKEFVLTPMGNLVPCYDKERSICNIFMLDFCDEEVKAFAIKEYKNKHLNINKLYDYAKKLNIYDDVKNIFEVLLCFGKNE